MFDHFMGQGPSAEWDQLQLFVSVRDWLAPGYGLDTIAVFGTNYGIPLVDLGFQATYAEVGTTTRDDQDGRPHTPTDYGVILLEPVGAGPDFSNGPIPLVVEVEAADLSFNTMTQSQNITIDAGQLRAAWLDPFPLDPDSLLDWFYSFDSWLLQDVDGNPSQIVSYAAAVVAGPIRVLDVALNDAPVPDGTGRIHRAASVIQLTVVADSGWTEGAYGTVAITVETGDGRKRTVWARFRVGDL